MSRPAALALALALALTLAATRARAESPSPVRLEWIRGESAETCPSGAWAAAEVRRRLGRDPFSMEGERSIEVTLQRTKTGWKGEVRDRPSSRAAAASRAFTSADPSCAPLAEALALAITLTLDPVLARARAGTPAAPSSRSPTSPAEPTSPQLPKDTGAPPRASTAEGAPASTPSAAPPDSAPPPSPAPSDGTALPSSPPPPSPPSTSTATATATSTATSSRDQPSSEAAASASPRVTEPARTEPPRLATSLGGGALVGLLPHTALDLQLSARVRIAGFLSAETAMFFLADNTTPDESLTFGLTAGRLGACLDLASGARGAVMICPQILLGALHTIVRDQRLAASGVSPWGAAAVDLEGDLAVVGRLYVGVRGGFIVPFAPYRLSSSDQKFPLFRQRPLALEGLLSIGVHFP